MNTFFEQIISEAGAKNPFYIRAKIAARMPTTEIVDRMEDGTYKIHVHAIPVRGASNEELCKYLKKSLKASEVFIVSGGRDSLKLIRITR